MPRRPARLQVCWRSGKVQLNSGIVERRHQNWDKAEMHFRLAKASAKGEACVIGRGAWLTGFVFVCRRGMEVPAWGSGESQNPGGSGNV